MSRAAAGMVVAADGDRGLVVHAPWPNPRKPGEPMWFGAVNLGKAYVSYHLMPVYAHPEMLSGMSDALRKRMQGKSCFNFRTTDPALFEEIEALTRRCAERWRTPVAL